MKESHAAIGSPLGSERRLAGVTASAWRSVSRAPAASAQAPGVTATSITIGATVPLTGPAAPGYDEIAPAMDAVFGWVNAHGGVYGRKIKYIYLDDQYNPAETATLTRKLVLQDNIFADVGSLGTPTQAAVQAFLIRRKSRNFLSSRAVTVGATRNTRRVSGGSRHTRSRGKFSVHILLRTSGARKSATCTQDDEFGQDFVQGSAWNWPRSR